MLRRYSQTSLLPEDKGLTFTCLLKVQQCIGVTKKGERCSKQVSMGTPRCTIHWKKEGLLVAKSTIPDSGNGVFAYGGKYATQSTVVFNKGDFITFYEGEVINYDELTRRYGYSTAVYAYGMSDNMFMDAAKCRGIASLINHSSKKADTNCIMYLDKKRGKQFLELQALRTIFHGQELFINYGPDYKMDTSVYCTVPECS